jgi:metal-sulfur cluster biosynthetic enzyme
MSSQQRFPSQAELSRILDEIKDPCSVAAGRAMGMSEMGLIEEASVQDGTVCIRVRLTSPTCIFTGLFRRDAEERVKAEFPDVLSVQVTFDTGLDWTPEHMSDEIRAERASRFGLLPVV